MIQKLFQGSIDILFFIILSPIFNEDYENFKQ